MAILFNSLLEQNGLPLKDVRLLRHKDRRAEKGKTPYELWQYDRKKFDRYQYIQNPKRRQYLKAKYWASFVGTPNSQTLFVGLFRVTYAGLSREDIPRVFMAGIDKAGTCDVYETVLDNRLKEFVGRLYIQWGAGSLAWVQRADKNNKPISELHSRLKEPEFPGFLTFMETLSKVKAEALPKSWIDILKISRGVYLLTCPSTKEQYVGSASGADGFWGRWQVHARTGQGDAIQLKSREPSDYQVSILEVFGTSTLDDEIIHLENRWKQKLRTKEMGLNGN
jgi:hypothetical protein